ncbi:MAG: hypothetical protein ACRDHS_11175, partial [Actinomycetota bacterium]
MFLEPRPGSLDSIDLGVEAEVVIPTLLLIGLVFGRWWRIAIPVAVLGWPVLLIATGVGSGMGFALAAATFSALDPPGTDSAASRRTERLSAARPRNRPIARYGPLDAGTSSRSSANNRRKASSSNGALMLHRRGERTP